MAKQRLQIVLASSSPRRIDFLKSAGLSPLIRPPEIDESPRRGERPRALVARLAKSKAEAVAAAMADSADMLIIAADTIVVSPDGKQILGKPVNEADARRMLRKLSGRTHSVLTAYALISASGGRRLSRVRVVSSRVRVRKLSPALVTRYVASGEPMGKAGSYAIQGLGASLIESVRGSYTNVVGLPMCELMADLEKYFGIELFG